MRPHGAFYFGGVEMKDFANHQARFEAWHKMQFKTESHFFRKNEDGSYQDDMLNAMFIGFCAGWMLK